MNWLGEWLKQIIFVVLMAGIVEMLLPSKSMERYVKLVLSLLVLMALLNPILKLLNGSPMEKLQQAIEEQLRPKSEGMTGLEQILKQGEQLRQASLEDSLKWAGTETAQQMKTQIESATGLDVNRVAVSIKVVPAGKEGAAAAASGKTGQPIFDKPEISGIKVYLNPAAKETTVMAGVSESESNEEQAQDASPKMSLNAIRIPGISPVQVQVSNIGNSTVNRNTHELTATSTTTDEQAAQDDDKDVAAEDEDGSQQAAAAPQTAETAEITRLLGSSWGVSIDKIRIYQLQDVEKQ